MAEAIPEEGASFHGVLHKMTATDMAALDKIEMSYDKILAKVRLYDGTIKDAVVYCRNNVTRGPDVDKPPSERYIDIIKEGCILRGVK